MPRRFVFVACTLALAGCASHGETSLTSEPSRHVGQRMLLPNAPGTAASTTVSYELRPQERFRMPQPLEAPMPQLPADSPRAALPPTAVCVRAVLSAQGEVLRVDPLDDRDECHAGAARENADLMQAVRERVSQWRFAPAAVCAWEAESPPAADETGCTGATEIKPVPVSLFYAFTFEIREGKASVRGGRTP